MNLPYVLDVAIGLIFIYLILSLLAAEIQELLTTLLQWRAAHLKKSIEILLTGGEGTKNDNTVKEIVNDLYNNPLLKNISQESKEGIEVVFRKVARFIITIGRKKNNKITLKGNEPSYIPSETFATTLIERLNLTQLAQNITALNFQKMIEDEISNNIDGYVKDENLQLREETRQILSDDFKRLQQQFNSIRADFGQGKATLLTSVNRLRDELDSFIAASELLAPSSEQPQTPSEQKIDPEVVKFIDQVKSLKNAIFYQGNPNYNNADYNNTDELIRRLQPNLAQIQALLVGEIKDQTGKVAQISETYQSFRKQFGNLNQNDEIYQTYEAIEQDISKIRDRLPDSLRESLADLARRAQINLKDVQTQVQTVEAEIYQFKNEIQVWFDRSMERASGVYKRNAKGVAFLIGFLLAFAINADTFHMVTRLTTDAVLRDALVESGTLATQVCPPSSTNADADAELECLQKEVNQSIPLPIGWDETNTTQQAKESQHWFFSALKRILGWLVSALAIAMGAPFWFDLLGKIVNVRNSGKPPATTSDRNSAG